MVVISAIDIAATTALILTSLLRGRPSPSLMRRRAVCASATRCALAPQHEVSRYSAQLAPGVEFLVRHVLDRGLVGVVLRLLGGCAVCGRTFGLLGPGLLCD